MKAGWWCSNLTHLAQITLIKAVEPRVTVRGSELRGKSWGIEHLISRMTMRKHFQRLYLNMSECGEMVGGPVIPAVCMLTSAKHQIDTWKYVAELVIKACFLILEPFGTLLGILGILGILEQSRVKLLLKGTKINLRTLRTGITFFFCSLSFKYVGMKI